MVFHAGILTQFKVLNPFGAVTARLNVGAPVFFALSGFLLYRPFVTARRCGARAVDVPRFYRRLGPRGTGRWLARLSPRADWARARCRMRMRDHGRVPPTTGSRSRMALASAVSHIGRP